jgi:hypothetical protein
MFHERQHREKYHKYQQNQNSLSKHKKKTTFFTTIHTTVIYPYDTASKNTASLSASHPANPEKTSRKASHEEKPASRSPIARK